MKKEFRMKENMKGYTTISTECMENDVKER